MFIMVYKNNTTIWISKKIKKVLDKNKLCNEEPYNSILKRLLKNYNNEKQK